MKKLPRISKAGYLTPTEWDGCCRVIESNLRELQIQPGIGYNVTNTSGGQTLKIYKNSSGISSFPFQCSLFYDAGYKVRVEYQSSLFKSLIPLKTHSITGLFNGDPASSSYPVQLDLDYTPGTWHDTSLTTLCDIVILEIEYDHYGNISTAAIETRGNGNTTDHTLPAWDTSLNALTAFDSATSPTYPQYVRVVLATFDGTTLTQLVNSNLCLINMNISGVAVKYPRSYA